MIAATRHLSDRYELGLAGAPGIDAGYYSQFVAHAGVKVVFGETYPLLAHATAALVTSGTATLETALFGVPQVVCYETPLPRLVGWLRRHVLKVPYVSLVNLIAGREVVRELVADSFTVSNIRRELDGILPGGAGRQAMMDGYDEVKRLLGDSDAPGNAARIMVELLGRVQPRL